MDYLFLRCLYTRGAMGYSYGLIWPPVGDIFVSSSVICVFARGCGATFSGLAGCISLPFVGVLARVEHTCV